MEENEVSSVETPEVAEPEVQQEQQTEVQDTKTNSAFADMRRKNEQFEKELKTRDEWVAKTFGKYGVNSWSDYQTKMEQQLQEQQNEEYKEKGIDPNVIDEIVKNHPAIKKAEELAKQQEETTKFNSEAQELFKAFPDLDIKSIPPEVFEMNKKGIPLTIAYKAMQYENVKNQTEKEVINKIKQNNNTPGSLSSGKSDNDTSIGKMSSDDFHKLQERVLRGEKVNF